MPELPRIGPDALEAHYQTLKKAHEDHLEKHGVKMPMFKKSGLYTQKSLALIALFMRLGEPVTKDELTNFVRKYKDGAKDLQEGRHLGLQDGWNILSKRRGDRRTNSWPDYSYSLISISEPFEGFHRHRTGTVDDGVFQELIDRFDRRCSLCGSREGEPNLRNTSVVTKLQAGHRDPSKEMSASNCLPQCQECNQPLQNKWIYDKRGRPKAIFDPSVVLSSPIEVQEQILELLRAKLKREIESED